MSRVETDLSIANAAPLFAALGDPTRLSLVLRLGDGQPRSISELSDGIDLTRQGISKHLRVLEQAGILSSERVGRESRFLIRPDAIEETRSYLDQVSAQWDRTLSRLKTFVEE